MQRPQRTQVWQSFILAIAMGLPISASAGIFGALNDLASAAQDAGVQVPSSVYNAEDATQNLQDAGQQAIPQESQPTQQTCPPGYTCTPRTPPPVCPAGDICTPASTTMTTERPDPYAGMMSALQRTDYIQIGHGPTVIYDIMDPMCMYCFGLFGSESQLIHEGYLTVRYVLLGTVTPSSSAHAAWILQSPDPAARLTQYDQTIEADNQTGQFGNLPEAQVDPATAQNLQRNSAIQIRYQFNAVPVVVYRGRSGRVHAFTAPTMTPQQLLQRIGLQAGATG